RGRRCRRAPVSPRRDAVGRARPRRGGACCMSGGVAVVTGATRGIGFALAEALVGEGMIVYAIGIDPARLAEASAQLASARLHGRRVAVTDPAALAQLVREIDAAHGRLDWMVNNAGLLAGGELADMSEAQMKALVDVNLWGVIHGSRLA